MRPIDHLQLGGVRDAARLRRRQIMIEHQHGGVGLERPQHQLLHLALADQPARVDLRPLLRHHVLHAHTRRLAQLLQLGDARLRVNLPRQLDMHHHRAILAVVDLTHAPDGVGPLLFQRADELEKIRPTVALQLVHADGVERGPLLVLGVGRKQVPDLDRPQRAVRLHQYGCHQIEAQLREIEVVVAGEPLLLEVRMNQPHAAKTSRSGAPRAQIRQEQFVRVTDDDLADVALAIDEDAHLARELVTALTQESRQLGRDDGSGIDAAPPDALEHLFLAAGEAVDVACKLFHSRTSYHMVCS